MCTFPEQRCIYLVSPSSCTSPPLPSYISPHLFLLYHALKCGLSFLGLCNHASNWPVTAHSFRSRIVFIQRCVCSFFLVVFFTIFMSLTHSDKIHMHSVTWPATTVLHMVKIKHTVIRFLTGCGIIHKEREWCEHNRSSHFPSASQLVPRGCMQRYTWTAICLWRSC